MVIRLLILSLLFFYFSEALATTHRISKKNVCGHCKTEIHKIRRLHQSHLRIRKRPKRGYHYHRGFCPIVQLIHKILAHLSFNHYQLGGSYLNLKQGIYRVDCSKYVDFLLQHTASQDYQNLVNHSNTPKPTSVDYFDFFNTIPKGAIRYNWYRVPTVKLLIPGDILVFRYKYLLARKTGGHVMVITKKPQFSQKIQNVYLIQISDAAPSGHTHDTRHKHTSGIGIGTLLLAVNIHSGAPFAYAWKWGARWQYNMDYAMARPLSGKSKKKILKLFGKNHEYF